MSDTQATGDVAVDTSADNADATTASTTAASEATDAASTTDAAAENTAAVTEPAEPAADAADAAEAEDAEDAEAEDAEDAEAEDAEDAVAAEKADKPSRVRQLEREGEVAADFLETLLDIADLDGDIDVDVDGDRAAVAIVDSEDGRVPRRLVGQGGKVLEALQELTRLAVQAETGERSRLMLDIAGHRAERRSTLVDLAKTAIEHVKTSGEKSSLEPMSAFERKVVHDEVAAAGLVSESEGVEPNRHVVILPA
ncbi:protein jag [Intrasporangium sp. YIM S08009]|uniref:Jag family protein n=1 Tax=Intrasporangium zincisolvens TaxID=3080018 RepID=UPI002B055E34|nr:R3H domain-containing nucleic acid-binding protein [Intrasporangium sp. YIM S08009]